MVEFDNIGQTSVRVSWMEPIVKNGLITAYRVQLQADNDDKMQESKLPYASMFTSCTLILFLKIFPQKDTVILPVIKAVFFYKLLCKQSAFCILL